MKVLTTAPTGSPEWAFHHQGRIGGATAADILGCGRNTPKHAWATITGRLKEDISHLSHIQMGVLLEPVIGKMWENRLKRKLLPSPGLLQNEALPWMVGTPDGIDQQTGGPWEAKSVGFWRRREWKLGDALRVRVQCEWYSAIMGNPGPVFFAALSLPSGGETVQEADDNSDAAPDNPESENDLLLWGQSDPDVEFQNRAIEYVSNWYEKYVKKDVEPPASSESDLRLLRRLYPLEKNGDAITASPGLAKLIMEWEASGRKASSINRDRKVLLTRIVDELKDVGWVKLPDGRFLRYTAEPRAGYTVAPSAPRVPRLMKEMKDARAS